MTEEKDEQYDRAEKLEEELEGVKEQLNDEIEELNGRIMELEEDLDIKNVEATLRKLGEQLHFTDSNRVQTEILRILSEEFNITMLVAPKKNY